MDQPMSNLQFRGMAMLFKVRDTLRPRQPILQEAHISRGDTVLDFGCGPGSYSLLAAQIVGPKGRVYALDIQPLAVKSVMQAALDRRLMNVYPIQSDLFTGLLPSTVDVALLYDIFHMFSEPQAVSMELCRVLKPGGRLSVNDHHLQDGQIVASITQSGLFQLAEKGQHTISFLPIKDRI
jgi:ubiquinone/menaquinone biosynthesis C-methylase UbiE